MTLFEKPGRNNTARTLAIAREAALRLGIEKIIIASNTGATVFAFPGDAISSFKLICVTHVYGFAKEEGNEMSEETRQLLKDKGVTVISAAHALSGAERSLTRRFSGVMPVEIMAHTLRMFSHGVKVGVEISAMACDAGAVKPGVPIIAVGGSTNGADSAIVLRPQPTHRILDTKIDEILCKPRVE